MLYAVVDGVKILASPGLSGQCPYCEAKMTPKCGSIITWHWAHTRLYICDDWFQPETEWHRNWKLIFGKENSEVIIWKDEKKHIADIKTKKGTIIELQNSNISYDTIQIREEFYGTDMIWIINATKFEKTFSKVGEENTIYDDYSPEFEYYAKLHGFTPKYKPVDRKKLNFKWQRPHESWTASSRDIYLDFGGDTLFCILEGAGKLKGKGYEISKLAFIQQHEGNELFIEKVL